jgi:pimeloyl-ACP methyl ester carboxylesterase
MIIEKNQTIKGTLGIPMATDYFVPEEKNNLPVIIYTHGFNGFKDWGNFDLIASEFANAGFLFIKYNLTHNGTSLDFPTEFVDLELYRENNYTKELLDLGYVIDFVFSENFPYKNRIDNESVSLLGHSRGGAISILGAIDHRISNVATWASIAQCTSPWTRFSEEKMIEWESKGIFFYENKRTNQQMPIGYQIYEDYLAHEEEYNLLDTVRSLKNPMLFIHGKDDPAVPYQAAEDLHAANPEFSKLLLCDGDHVFGRKHPWPHDYLPEETKFVVNETIQFFKS